MTNDLWERDSGVTPADSADALRAAGGLSAPANFALRDLYPFASAGPKGHGDGAIDVNDVLALTRMISAPS